MTVKERLFLFVCMALVLVAFYATGEFGWHELKDSVRTTLPALAAFYFGRLSYKWELDAEKRRTEQVRPSGQSDK